VQDESSFSARRHEGKGQWAQRDGRGVMWQKRSFGVAWGEETLGRLWRRRDVKGYVDLAERSAGRKRFLNQKE